MHSGLETQHTCYFLKEKCPKCGAPLATDGKHVWCSNGETTCEWEESLTTNDK